VSLPPKNAATAVPPPDPDRGDWSDPAAHARYLVALQAALATGPGDSEHGRLASALLAE
jgi:hypothetical protein